MLTLEEIENISFHKSGLGGYKIDEVDDFVDQVVKKIRRLERENRELEGRIETQDKEIQKHKEREESVQSAIITAEMTAKQIVMEATRKSDEQLSESREEADKIINDAKERAEKLNAETDAEIEEKVNKALRDSSDKIEENNRILDAQKKSIIRLMGEANKFRNSLLQTYKNHLSVINAMSKAEDFKKQQKELEERYPAMEGNKPVTFSEKKADEDTNADTAENDTEQVKEPESKQEEKFGVLKFDDIEDKTSDTQNNKKKK